MQRQQGLRLLPQPWRRPPRPQLPSQRSGCRNPLAMTIISTHIINAVTNRSIQGPNNNSSSNGRSSNARSWMILTSFSGGCPLCLVEFCLPALSTCTV